MEKEKQYYSIWMMKEAVIEMLKKDAPDNDCIKTLDIVKIDEGGRIYFDIQNIKNPE